ncbi:hypothetical protein [Halomonas sp. PR-M31]|nr:hypothetical protein [Halomonas sp. PR-M31]
MCIHHQELSAHYTTNVDVAKPTPLNALARELSRASASLPYQRQC